MILDEIHLLGADRGPILEVIIDVTFFLKQSFYNKIQILRFMLLMWDCSINNIGYVDKSES